MLPSIGFGETILILLVAIVVVGPEDLPKLLRQVGRWVAKVKAMGAEFREAFDEMGAEAEIEALRKEIRDLKTGVDGGLQNEMRALDTELRQATNIRHPAAPAPKPETEAGPAAEGKTEIPVVKISEPSTPSASTPAP